MQIVVRHERGSLLRSISGELPGLRGHHSHSIPGASCWSFDMLDPGLVRRTYCVKRGKGGGGSGGRGQRGCEGRRRCGEELGCWMHVCGMV